MKFATVDLDTGFEPLHSDIDKELKRRDEKHTTIFTRMTSTATEDFTIIFTTHSTHSNGHRVVKSVVELNPNESASGL